MKITSISTKITIIFVAALLLLGVSFISYINIQKHKQIRQMHERHTKTAKYIFGYFRHNNYIDNDYFKAFDYEYINESSKKEIIIKKGKFVFERRIPPGFIKIIRYKRDIFIMMSNREFSILIKDLKQNEQKGELFFWFISGFFLLIIIYIWILKSLKPLKDLRENIREFANGNLKIECKSNKNDEIAEVANEFDNAVRKIDSLISSRQLFLRTIMHELKTPIGKGRIVTELIDDQKQKDRLISVFERLDLLIEEFSKIEHLISKNYDLKLKEYKISDIIDQSIDLLMIDDTKNHVQIEINNDFLIKTDFELFALALKNLLDNGIRYSDNKSVQIIVNKNEIIIKNRSERLKQQFSDYFKPFHNGTGKNGGLGLGLYIVKNILDLLILQFSYQYKDGFNMFMINKK